MTVELIKNWPSLYLLSNDEQRRKILVEVDQLFPISTHYNPNEEVHHFWKEVLSDELIFFGGSFFPWHKGHQTCLNFIDPKKKCLILPDRNPQKDLMLQKPEDYFVTLIQNLELRPGHHLSPSFILSPYKNPTFDWVNRLTEHYPQAKISLLMGFDSLRTIESWIRANELLPRLSKLYVLSRLERDDEAIQVKLKLESTFKQLQIEYLGHHEFENLSSTELRK